MKMTTLCYIEQNDCYLMLHRVKKKQDINAGKWIGVGGHAIDGETPEECLLREVLEETGLILTSYQFRGIVTFLCDDYEPEMMCVFTADAFTGTLIECREGELHWIPKQEVLKLPTWEGDIEFLRPLLEGDSRFFSMKLVYQKNKLVERKKQFY